VADGSHAAGDEAFWLPLRMAIFESNLSSATDDERRVEQEAGKPGRFGDGSDVVIGACIEVHRHLGPGLLESAYERCLAHELELHGLAVECQRPVPLRYKAVSLDCGYRIDLVVDHALLVEVKAVDRLLPIHQAQVLTYLRLTELRVGLLVNFHSTAIKRELRRLTLSENFAPSRLPVDSQSPPEGSR
jgi:GxxExxY protein